MKKYFFVALICTSLTACGSTSTPSRQAEIPSVSSTQSGVDENSYIKRLTVSSGISWEDGRLEDGNIPEGLRFRLIPSDPTNCDVDIFIFETGKQTESAISTIKGWNFSSLTNFVDTNTDQGIIFGERAANQECTNKVLKTFGQ